MHAHKRLAEWMRQANGDVLKAAMIGAEQCSTLEEQMKILNRELVYLRQLTKRKAKL